MINRRNTSRISGDDDEEETLRGGRSADGAPSGIPVLPKGKTKRKRRRKASPGNTLNLRRYIPFCFVFSYMSIVMISIFLLLRYFWKPKGSPSIESSFKGDMIVHPVQNEYPKILRDPQEYPPLSPEVLKMCTQALWHTIETTTIVMPDGETFIHTGNV